MTRRISLLPDVLAHKIAAGEVVERPASVVKELVENAIDAQATTIEIEIRAGGKEYIRISDDGVGIHPEDLKTAFLAHATSKIHTVDDLFAIQTLGFRGEALPSIASVSQLNLKTRQHNNDRGYEIRFRNDQPPQVQPVGMGPGTTVEVWELFYNTPARYKFLKTTATERRYIVDFVAHISLAHPHIAFKLVADEKVVFRSNGKGDLLEVLSAVYDYTLAKAMLPVDFTTSWGRIRGYVAPPDFTRGNRQSQLFILNGRVIKNPMFNYALEKAYHGMLASRQYPVALLVLTMNPQFVDVNVHPTKSEVRFQEEQAIYRDILSAVKQGLLSHDLSVPIQKPAASTQSAVKAEQTALDLNKHFPWQPQTWAKVDEILLASLHPRTHETPVQTSPADTAVTYQPNQPSPARQPGEQGEHFVKESESTPRLDSKSRGHSYQVRDQLLNGRIIGQLQRMYILLEVSSGLWILDQHIVHERILYERLCAKQYTPHIQQVLPQNLDFSTKDSALITEHLAELRSLGIELEGFGNNSFLLRGLPQFLAAEGFLEDDILQLLSDLERGDNWQQKSALTLACKGAVKAGQALTHNQIHSLLTQLVETENPFTCPHGRPIIVKLEEGELLKRFGR